jgi:uncharacterized protein (DUF2267 family)
MSAAGLESIDHTVQLTHIWINDLDSRLGWENKHRSYRLLRTVLQALRDWLPVNEAVGLSAQLRWRPGTAPRASARGLLRELAAGHDASETSQESRVPRTYC